MPMVKNQDFEQEFMSLANFWFSQKDYQQAAFYSTEAIRQNGESAAAWQKKHPSGASLMETYLNLQGVYRVCIAP